MSVASAGQKQGHRWQKGESGNPRGREAGSRNQASLAVEAMMQGEAEAITARAIELARAGDTTALRLVLDRIAPVRRSRPVRFHLPRMGTAADLAAGFGAVTRAVAAGELSPEEGQAVAAVLEAQRRGIETAELEARIARLEAQHEQAS